MPRPYRPAEVIRILESFGWGFDRQRGSHYIMKKPGQRSITIPTSRREVKVGTLGGIVNDAGLTRREFDERASQIL